MYKEEEANVQDITFEQVRDWVDTNQENKHWLGYITPQFDKKTTAGIRTFRENHSAEDIKTINQKIKEGFKEQEELFKEREAGILKRESMNSLREQAIEKSIEHGINPKLGLRMVDVDEPTTSGNFKELFSEMNRIGDQRWKQFQIDNVGKQETGDEPGYESLRSMVIKSGKSQEFFEANQEVIFKKLEQGESA